MAVPGEIPNNSPRGAEYGFGPRADAVPASSSSSGAGDAADGGRGTGLNLPGRSFGGGNTVRGSVQSLSPLREDGAFEAPRPSGRSTLASCNPINRNSRQAPFSWRSSAKSSTILMDNIAVGARETVVQLQRQVTNALENMPPLKEVAKDLGRRLGVTDELPDGSWAQQQCLEMMSPMRRRTLAVVQSTQFESCMGILVLVNCVSLGVENEVLESSSADDGRCDGAGVSFADEHCRAELAFKYLDFVFLFAFTLEVVVRFYAFGVARTIGTVGGLFDFAIVAVGWITEVIVPLIMLAASPDLAVLQTLKMLRVLRAVRVLRMATMFKDLWFVVQSFFRCLRPLLWIMLFIMVILFLFAILAINFIGKNSAFADIEDLDVQARFGSTFNTMVTLFQIATLDEWFNILNPLFEAAGWTYLFFLTYIAISALALMNLVTAVVVDTSVRRTREESHEEMQKQAFGHRVALMVDDLQELFEIFDADGSGFLEMEEFVSNALSVPLLEHLFRVLGVNREKDLQEIFSLIAGDTDKLTMNDFVEAVTKMSQAASDRTVVAVIRTARSHKERMRQVRNIVQRQPQVLSQISGIQDGVAAADLKIRNLDQELKDFKAQLNRRVGNLRVSVDQLVDTVRDSRRPECRSTQKALEDVPNGSQRFSRRRSLSAGAEMRQLKSSSKRRTDSVELN